MEKCPFRCSIVVVVVLLFYVHGKHLRRNESMSPDRVSNPGPLTYESGALPIALRGPAPGFKVK